MLRKPEEFAKLLDDECAFTAIRERAEQERYPENQVFINLIPIVMNAVARAFSVLCENGVQASGYDSQVYLAHFNAEPVVDLRRSTFKQIRAPSR